MQRVAIVLGLFLALCATIYLLGAPDEDNDEAFVQFINGG